MPLLALGLGAGALRAQSPSEMVTGPTMPVQLPLSGQGAQTGAVGVVQGTTNAGGGNTVNSIQSSVTVQMPYGGSVPTGVATPGPLSLTLAEALKRGLHNNLGVIGQNASVSQAEGQRGVAKSTLLPNLNTGISEVFERENLRTLGVSLASIPEASKFNYVDGRAARLNQSVFDLVRIDNLHSASESLKASIKAVHNARDLIVLAVGGSYLQLIATQSRIVAAQAQVESDRAIAKQAADRFAAGVAVRVDQQRAQVQLGTDQQRLRSLQADRDTQMLQFGRIIGLPLGQQFLIADDYGFRPMDEVTQEVALQRAFQARADLQAAQASVRAAELNVKAAHAERAPQLVVTADFGGAGTTPSQHSTSVYTVAGTLTIPLYEGGRIKAEVEQADAAVRQRKAEFENVRGQIDEDVRQAFINLTSAADQVGIAVSNVELAHSTLQQSRDRFAAGIADSVEVVQAEQTVVQADNDYITAVYEHNLAKVSLARAMGNAETNLPQLLRK
ncbi:MAG: TolC family protein [Janthinobacterium lividum]